MMKYLKNIIFAMIQSSNRAQMFQFLKIFHQRQD